jgi:hypothetical protein
LEILNKDFEGEIVYLNYFFCDICVIVFDSFLIDYRFFNEYYGRGVKNFIILLNKSDINKYSIEEINDKRDLFESYLKTFNDKEIFLSFLSLSVIEELNFDLFF